MSNRKNFLYLFLMLLFFFGLVANLGAADNYLEKGIAEYKAENYEEALEFFEKAYKENPKDPQVTSYLGLTQREMQNHPEAARFFKETININPKASEIKLLLADTLYNIGGYEDALKAVDGAISDGIKPAQSHYLKGLILLKLNRSAEAIGAFKKASELDPSLKQQSDFQIASIYVQEKKYKEAGDTFKTRRLIGRCSQRIILPLSKKCPRHTDLMLVSDISMTTMFWQCPWTNPWLI